MPTFDLTPAQELEALWDTSHSQAINDNFTLLGGVRATYVPTVTAVTTNPTLTFVTQTGRYALLNKLCFVEINIKINVMTNAGSGNWLISLPADPVVPADTTYPCLFGFVYDISTTTRQFVSGERQAASSVAMGRNGASGYVTHAAPFAWAAGDQIHLTGTYEVA